MSYKNNNPEYVRRIITTVREEQQKYINPEFDLSSDNDAYVFIYKFVALSYFIMQQSSKNNTIINALILRLCNVGFYQHFLDDAALRIAELDTEKKITEMAARIMPFPHVRHGILLLECNAGNSYIYDPYDQTNNNFLLLKGRLNKLQQLHNLFSTNNLIHYYIYNEPRYSFGINQIETDTTQLISYNLLLKDNQENMQLAKETNQIINMLKEKYKNYDEARRFLLRTHGKTADIKFKYTKYAAEKYSSTLVENDKISWPLIHFGFIPENQHHLGQKRNPSPKASTNLFATNSTTSKKKETKREITATFRTRFGFSNQEYENEFVIAQNLPKNTIAFTKKEQELLDNHKPIEQITNQQNT